MPGLTLETFAEATLPRASAPGATRPHRAVAVCGAEPEVLIDIRRPEVNLAVWDRDLPAGFTRALRALLAAAPFTATAEAEPEDALLDLAARLPCQPPLDLLFDLQDLAILFARIADTGGPVRIRLEGITGPACHRWHADAVGLRLLCTYRGPGTDLLPIPGGGAAARALGSMPPCEPARLGTGAVGLLKGDGYPGNAGAGCIHRSPPAGPGARARLLACIDEPGRIPLE